MKSTIMKALNTSNSNIMQKNVAAQVNTISIGVGLGQTHQGDTTSTKRDPGEEVGSEGNIDLVNNNTQLGVNNNELTTSIRGGSEMRSEK
jgi:hypothetical protein